MTTIEIKTKLHEEIEHGDDKLLKMIYAIVKEYNDEDSFDDKRLELIRREREDYLNGRGKSYSWEEVRNMAISKQRPNDL